MQKHRYDKYIACGSHCDTKCKVSKLVSFVCLVIVDSINDDIKYSFGHSINFETDLHYLLIIKVNTDFDVGFDADIDINKDTTYPCIILVDIDYS